MSPGGHLLTTLAACGASLFLTRELALQMPRSITVFYCFTHRLAHRFDAAALSGVRDPFTTSERFLRAFFAGPTPTTSASLRPPRAVRSLSPDRGRRVA